MAAGLLLLTCTPARASEFVKGADLSLLTHLQQRGVVYRDASATKNPLLIFKAHGTNLVRLRLFLSPNGAEGQVNTLSYTIRLAQEVKRSGLRLLLDFHYSDGWADPGHQVIPAEWAGLSHAQVVERLYTYTRETLAAFRREGCSPDMVEVGNEITNGMVWPDAGPLWDPKTWNDTKNPMPPDTAPWDRLADLLKAGIQAVRDEDRDGRIEVMVHIDKGGSRESSRHFLEQLFRRGVNFDVIGLSYYPFWHGTLADLRDNLTSLAGNFHKDIVVVETGYDQGGGEQKDMPHPLTPAGQRAFMDELIRIVASTPGNRGRGVCYWAPEWIRLPQAADSGIAGSGDWESRAWFDAKGNALPVMRSYEAPVETGGRQ